MNENINNPEHKPTVVELVALLGEHLSEDDIEFLNDLEDFEDALGYAYGSLLKEGYDPDLVLESLAITE